MNINPRRLILIAILYLFMSRSFGQPNDLLSKRISEYATRRHFNGTILIEQHGKRLYSKSFGLASFQYDIPNTSSTKYKIASITKLFTATLILQLVDVNKLDLNQTISGYLPGYKGEAANRVKIINLLTATSGIESNEKEIGSDDIPAAYAKPYTSDQMLDRFCSGKLDNDPGKVWNYNNADYIILGKIIEAVYKRPYEQVLNGQILAPLNMRNTGMFGTIKIIKNLATVYMLNDSTRQIENMPGLYTENYWAAGGLYSTADDLLQFANALYSYKLIKKSSLEKMLTPNLANYAMGIWVTTGSINKKKFTLYDRQGAIWGIRTRLEHIPEQDLTFVLLTNAQTADIDAMQAEIIQAMVH